MRLRGKGEVEDMKIITKKRLFIRKHYDFLLVDLLAVVLGFIVAYIFRRSLNINMYNQDYLWVFATVSILSFLLVEIASENLNGIIARGLVRETQVVVTEMTIAWTVYITILFLTHTVFALSRIFAGVTYILSIFFLLLFRNLWKMFSKFSRKSEEVMPELLIVSEASRTQAVLERLVPGALSRQYEICAVVMNGKGIPDYHDWYPHDTGLENISKYIGQRRVQYAYVELDDREEEKTVIDQLLNAGVVVHRSLGDSVLDYADQEIGQLNGKSVIVISGAKSSLTSRADKAWQRLRQKMSNAREKAPDEK